MIRAAIPQAGGVGTRHGAGDGRAIQREAGVEMLVEPRHRGPNRDTCIALAVSRSGGGDRDLGRFFGLLRLRHRELLAELPDRPPSQRLLELPAAVPLDVLVESRGEVDAGRRGTIHDIEERVRSLRARILAGCFDQAILASNLKALGDANRLRIIELLKHDEDMCACRLLEELDISQSTLSHHMSILCDAHLVQARRDGRWIRYRLDKDGLAELGSTLARDPAE